jgi:hypothetical protein
LFFLKGGVPKWLREQSAKLRFSGSNPLAASRLLSIKNALATYLHLAQSQP